MSLLTLTENAVALAGKILDSYKESVTFVPWVGQTGAGVDAYGSPVALRAFVDKTRKPQQTPSGRLVLTLATMYFTEQIPNTTATNPAQFRVNPVDPRDKFILNDGTTGPVIKSGGFEDAGKTTPFVNTVVLGIP